MHDDRKWARCCIFAMRYEEWAATRKFNIDLAVRGMSQINSPSRLVLFRRPYPTSLCRGGAYVPPCFRAAPVDTLTEDEKIAALPFHPVLPTPPEILHPAEYMYNGIYPIPPTTYLCRGCNTPGSHFRADCPTNESNELVEKVRGLDRMPRPHGIPKSLLRKVAETDRDNRTMRDELGDYYALRTPPRPRLKPRLAGGGPRVEDVEPHVDAKWPDSVWMHLMSVEYDGKGGMLGLDDLDTGVAYIPNDEEDLYFRIEDMVRTLDQKNDEIAHQFYRANPSKRQKRQAACTHWMIGLCVKGALECEYLHNALPENIPICKFFVKGECTNTECTFRHVRPPPPPRAPCPHYTEGFCASGPRCGLAHNKSVIPIMSVWEEVGLPKDKFLCVLSCVTRPRSPRPPRRRR